MFDHRHEPLRIEIRQRQTSAPLSSADGSQRLPDVQARQAGAEHHQLQDERPRHGLRGDAVGDADRTPLPEVAAIQVDVGSLEK